MTQLKRYTATLAAAAADGYAASGILSAAKIDRAGDTIDPKAYKPYVGKRIPALFGHDHEKILGTWENLRIERDQLIGDLKLAATELGNMVKALIEANVPLMNSIGFRGEGVPIKDTYGTHFTELDLMEASVVAVGCNPHAVMIAKRFNYELPTDVGQMPTVRQKVLLKRAAAALAQAAPLIDSV